ncbi:MAG: hypothetical protein ACUVYA_14610 [Planctomycetota bacterium]
MLNRLGDVFGCFERHDERYLVVGGASVLHGVPRVTFYLDMLIEATQANAERLLAAPLEAGLGTASLTAAEDVLAHEITVFRDRVRIDVQTRTPGIEVEGARSLRRWPDDLSGSGAAWAAPDRSTRAAVYLLSCRGALTCSSSCRAEGRRASGPGRRSWAPGPPEACRRGRGRRGSRSRR